MVLESSTFNSLTVKPSPLSLASQHLHGKMYLIPLVGTATDSSSTNQQLSGVTPLWPSWAAARDETERGERELGIQKSLDFVWSTSHALQLQLIIPALESRYVKSSTLRRQQQQTGSFTDLATDSPRFSLPPSWSLLRQLRSTRSAPCHQLRSISFLLPGPATDGLSRRRSARWWWHKPWLWCCRPGPPQWTPWSDKEWLHEGPDQIQI